MKTIILLGAAAMALAAGTSPGAAQTHDMSDMGQMHSTMSDAQMQMYEGWPQDRRTMFDAWPADYQTYFWTLNPVQQNGWWVLTDDQRTKVYAMTPEQRTQAWTAIAAQMNGAAMPSATAAVAMTAAAGASMGGPRFVSNAVVQTTPAATRVNGEYPPCKGDLQDSCINPREAGLNYGNVPLKYWPGKPASEIRGKMPARK